MQVSPPLLSLGPTGITHYPWGRRTGEECDASKMRKKVIERNDNGCREVRKYYNYVLRKSKDIKVRLIRKDWEKVVFTHLATKSEWTQKGLQAVGHVPGSKWDPWNRQIAPSPYPYRGTPASLPTMTRNQLVYLRMLHVND